MTIVSRPPDWTAAMARLESSAGAERFFEVVRQVTSPTVGDRYRHWHELRHLQPPHGLTHEEWWAALKFRRSQRRRLPLLDTKGAPFAFVMVDAVHRMCHELDSQARGQIESSEPIVTPQQRDRFITSSLMEEALSSSMLEGAVTTRRVAKDLLRSGRQPISHGERMVRNNYLTMRWVSEHRADPLTPDFVLHVHRLVTQDTLDDPATVGRLRQPDEDIVVRALDTDEAVHVPPPARELESRLDTMCRWANEESEQPFIHPAIRSIALHFWLAFDHPFVDGNGRTARALFYWSMLRRDYWLCEFLPISRLFLEAPSRYARAFQYTETDDNDLTYFVLFHLDTLMRAIADLRTYLQRKSREQSTVVTLLRESVDLNHRQIALLTHALQHGDAEYTIASHGRSHGVVYQTARTDLLDLASRGLITKRRIGNAFVFEPKSDIENRLKRLR